MRYISSKRSLFRSRIAYADWCGLIQVDLNLNLWTPFWWFNTGATDKTMILTEEYESAEFLDRWVQAVRKGIPMIVPDAEATKEAYPAEYNLYQRLGIRSVIAVSLEPRPVALLAVRNPKRYIQQTSMLRILAYVLLASYNEQKMLNRLQMVNISTSIQNSKDPRRSLCPRSGRSRTPCSSSYPWTSTTFQQRLLRPLWCKACPDDQPKMA